MNLLFHIPLLTGVLLTADTLLLLWLTRLGIRVIEAFVLSLIAIIAVCFAIEILWAGTPILSDVVRGIVPHLSANNHSTSSYSALVAGPQATGSSAVDAVSFGALFTSSPDLLAERYHTFRARDRFAI